MSKLTRPDTSRAIDRARLHRPLDDCLERDGVCVVSAAAGWGKTTLVASYTAHRDLPHAWYTPDESDRDLPSFVAYLQRALRDLLPDLQLASVEPETTPAALALDLLTQIGVLLRHEALLVLDDLESVLDSPQVVAFLSALVRRLPERLRLILISRVNPYALSIRRLTHRGLAVLSEEHLAFTASEVRRLFAQEHGRDLTSSQEGEIVRATEGWGVAVTFADRAFAGAGTYSSAMLRHCLAGLDELVGYVTTEATRHLSSDERDFLLRAALLEGPDPMTLERILQGGSPGAMLQALSRKGVYLRRASLATPAYRFQPLARACLLKGLQLELPALERSQLMARAAQILQEEGRTEEAFEYLLEVWPAEAVARELEMRAGELYGIGPQAMALAESWAQRLSPDLEAVWPLHELRRSLSRLTDSLATETLGLGEKERFARTLSLSLGHLLSGRDQDVAIALADLEDFPSARSSGALRLRGLLTRGAALLALGRHRQASLDLRHALRLSRRQRLPFYTGIAIYLLAQASLDTGWKLRAGRLARYVFQASAGWPPGLRAYPLTTLVQLHLLQGDASRALQLAMAAHELAQEGGRPLDIGYALLHLAVARLRSGQLRAARDAIEAAGEQLPRGGWWDVALLLLRAGVARAEGDGGATRAHGERAQQLLQLGGHGERARRMLDLLPGLAEFLAAEDRREQPSPGQLLEADVEERPAEPAPAPTAPQAPEPRRPALSSTGQLTSFEGGQRALRLRLLGDVEVYRRGELIPAKEWRPRTARWLLLFFVTHRNRRLPKEVIGEALWPEFSPDRLGNNLNVAVSTLRKILEPELESGAMSRHVLRDGDQYIFELTADDYLDVDAFDELSRPALVDRPELTEDELTALERARALYQADYARDEPYKEYLVLERERLRDRYLTVLSALGRHYETKEDFETALSLSEEILRSDNYREDVYQQMIRLYLKMGDRGRAMRTYRVCEDVLRDELGVSPDDRTRSLVAEGLGEGYSVMKTTTR